MSPANLNFRILDNLSLCVFHLFVGEQDDCSHGGVLQLLVAAVKRFARLSLTAASTQKRRAREYFVALYIALIARAPGRPDRP
jgi:hypothetical protein